MFGVALQLHEQVMPFALPKDSLPSLNVSQAISNELMTSSLPMPVSWKPALSISRTTDRYRHALEQAASAKMAGDFIAVPTLVL